MCVILIGKVTKQMHESALATNRDGFSLFTEELGLIKAPTAVDVKKAIGKYGVWHYRIGTSGKMGTANIHPFRVCNGKYLLYHNGVLGKGKKELSDTAALAETMKDMSLKTVRTILLSLKTGQRFALVSATNPKSFELFGEWSCDEGVLMSHKLYVPVSTYPSYYRGGKPVEKYKELYSPKLDEDYKKEEDGYDSYSDIFKG